MSAGKNINKKNEITVIEDMIKGAQGGAFDGCLSQGFCFPECQMASCGGNKGERRVGLLGVRSVMELGNGGVGKLRYLTRSKRAAKHEGSALGMPRRNYAAN